MFDPNANPDTELSQAELDAFGRYYGKDALLAGYGNRQMREAILAAEPGYYLQGQFQGLDTFGQYPEAAIAAADGIARPTRQSLSNAGIIATQDDSGYEEDEFFAGNKAKLFPQTHVPKPWKMQHQKARGGHIAFLSKTEAAYFTRKSSANVFVKSWNAMMAHLGSAAEFDQLRLASLFAAVLEAGSGQNGIANGFTPPMNGQ
jgi:hypothetical protein